MPRVEHRGDIGRRHLDDIGIARSIRRSVEDLLLGPPRVERRLDRLWIELRSEGLGHFRQAPAVSLIRIMASWNYSSHGKRDVRGYTTDAPRIRDA